MRLDLVIYRMAALGFLAVLILTIMDPFGYVFTFNLLGRSDSLHNVTLLSFLFLTLFGWRVFKRAPLKIRVLVTGAFCLVAYGLYDLLWFLDYFTYTISSLSSVLLGAVIYAGMFLVLPLAGICLAAAHYNLPRIQLKMLALVLVLNVFAIGLLELSGFFPAYIRFLNGLTPVDPHGWIWFLGKVLGMCSFFLVYLGKRSCVSGGLRDFLPGSFSLVLIREKSGGINNIY